MIDTISYSDFFSRLDGRWTDRRVPLFGMIEVTRRCPQSCVHCYNNLPLGDTQEASKELSLAEHCRILDEIAEAGCLWLTYTGGEIFAREDFLDIYAHARKRGFFVTLFTGGTLITPSIADRLACQRPRKVEITVYGRTPETHDRVTRVPGSHERCMQAVRLLAERGIPYELKTMVLSLNQHELPQIRHMAEVELGVRFRFDPLITPRLDRSRGPLALRLSAGDVVELDRRDPKRARGFAETVHQTDGCAVEGTSNDLYQCRAGINAFGIDPHGGLNLCLFSPGGKYDLRMGSFREGWDTVVLADRSRKLTRSVRCMGCSIRRLCGTCPPCSELENGDPEEFVAHCCEVAHLRAQAFSVPVTPHGECEYCTQLAEET
jgi:radical SAM protein with 4Fe4S-binding SPASM domain